ncbi:agamous-like MADS-box protein AGL86 [Solanum verrucosum]|uniref:agamous-like MADS-box protein AGL86 n=1 Tax=Solanum verrucosum TaxID=315347 RepID=UPI0020D1032E|nr:agamous-like MADS-box protein AGL86 [Solanum verrucosum]
MPRNKVKLALIENESDRKVSYKKREKGFLKKAHELNTLCDVEIAAVIDSPYNNEPTVFPNYDAAINTFVKFKELPTLEKSKNMVTREEFTKKRIEKMEEKLLKVRKQNRLKEITNEMYEVTRGKDISPNMDPYDFNDLSYMIKKNLLQIREAMNGEEVCTSNVPEPIVEPIIIGGTNFEGSKATLLATARSLLPMIPLESPPMVPSGTNFEKTRPPLFVPNVAPPTVPLSASPKVTQQMVYLANPSRTPIQMVPLMDTSQVNPSLLFSSQIFPPMVPHLFSTIPQQMAIRRTPGMAFSMPSATMSSLMPSPMIAPPVCSPLTSQMDPSTDLPPMGASMLINNHQNYTANSPQSPPLSELLNWNNDDVVTLLEDPSLHNINVQDPNRTNNT